MEEVLNTSVLRIERSCLRGDVFSTFGRDSFLVDGDSLCSAIMGSWMIDWSPVHGGQILQLVYHVEVLLKKLRERSKNFRVFFFENMSTTLRAAAGDSATSATDFLAREVLRHHLTHNTNIPVDVLPSMWDDSFGKYLDFYEPTFVFLKSEWEPATSLTSRETLLRVLMLDLLSRDFAVCLFEKGGLEAKDNIEAYYLLPVWDRHLHAVCRETVAKAGLCLLQVAPAAAAPAVSEMELMTVQAALKTLQGSSSCGKEENREGKGELELLGLAAVAVKGVLAGAEGAGLPASTAAVLCKAYMLQCALGPLVPLQYRGQVLPPLNSLDASSSELLADLPRFVPLLAANLLQALEAHPALLTKTSSPILEEAADEASAPAATPLPLLPHLYDGRFLCSLLLLLNSLPAAAAGVGGGGDEAVEAAAVAALLQGCRGGEEGMEGLGEEASAAATSLVRAWRLATSTSSFLPILSYTGGEDGGVYTTMRASARALTLAPPRIPAISPHMVDSGFFSQRTMGVFKEYETEGGGGGGEGGGEGGYQWSNGKALLCLNDAFKLGVRDELTLDGRLKAEVDKEALTDRDKAYQRKRQLKSAQRDAEALKRLSLSLMGGVIKRRVVVERGAAFVRSPETAFDEGEEREEGEDVEAWDDWGTEKEDECVEDKDGDLARGTQGGCDSNLKGRQNTQAQKDALKEARKKEKKNGGKNKTSKAEQIRAKNTQDRAKKAGSKADEQWLVLVGNAEKLALGSKNTLGSTDLAVAELEKFEPQTDEQKITQLMKILELIVKDSASSAHAAGVAASDACISAASSSSSSSKKHNAAAVSKQAAAAADVASAKAEVATACEVFRVADEVCEVVSGLSPPLTKDVAKAMKLHRVARALRGVGLADAAWHVEAILDPEIASGETRVGSSDKKDKKKDKKKSDKKDKKKDKKEEARPTTPPSACERWGSMQRFQMLRMAEHLPRPRGSVKDPRVGFVPDDWQRRLLDIVDKRQSALIAAPTSAGKTFISYYTIEDVLRQDSTGVVVYVAPTKQLVNQMVAEVNARYTKNYRGSGAHMVGVFTRDFRYNELSCQVLITVPACLEILLMSPQHRDWVSRLRYVILDEVHLIGEEDGGVWENLILTINCPFLALSATIGNKEAFAAWLQKVEASRGRTLQLVEHTERYNDLALFVYDHRDRARGGGMVEEVHPAAGLHMNTLTQAGGGFPADCRLLPEQCIVLYDALKEELERAWGKDGGAGEEQELEEKVVVQRRGFLEELAKLQPEIYFTERRIVMNSATKYQRELKALVEALARFPQGRARVAAVLQAVGGRGSAAVVRADKLRAKMGAEKFRANLIVPLLEAMGREKLLPAIVFHLNRKGCEEMAYHLEAYLRRQEEETRRKEGFFDRYEKQQEELETRAKEMKRASKQASSKAKKHATEEEMQEEQMERETTNVNALDPKRVDERFVFRGKRQEMLTVAEVAKLTGVWEDRVEETFGTWLRIWQRGIGVHHAGMPRKHKVAVEQLFRAGRMAVIFSTGTLALGINMPCRSVVLAGDSPALHAMSYRQMAGRAGRRGWDTRGSVIFFGLPRNKVMRLLNSRLPSLTCDGGLSCSLALRLMILHSGAAAPPVPIAAGATAPTAAVMSQMEALRVAATKATRRLVSQPMSVGLLHGGAKEASLQVEFMYRFYAGYLETSGLLKRSGQPVDMAGLVSHLYFTEPSNHVVTGLFASGVMQQLLDEESSDSDAIESLLLVLCHFFSRLPLHSSAAARVKRELAAGTLSGPSLVLLPPLPAIVASYVQTHNNNLASLFSEYMRTYASARASDLAATHPSHELPLSALCCGRTPPIPSALSGDEASTPPSAPSSLLGMLRQSSPPVVLRSPFVASSGFSDRFASVNELAESGRAGLRLSSSMVPICGLTGSEEGEGEGKKCSDGHVGLLNAYILDMWRHGMVKALIRYNGVPVNGLYDLLKNFSLILRALAMAVRFKAEEAKLINSALQGPEALPRMVRLLTQLAIEFQEKFAHAFKASS